MAVDIDTSDRLHRLEMKLYELESEIQRERSDRELTITAVLSMLPAVVIWLVVLATSLAAK